ncbi:MAG: hypothetical protein ACKVJK_19455 [Methylophagaceae bacterium]|jgi:hypothetical protein|tara:strand:- start:1328 stop:1777 length:450 start_codon:yes stop_codon:yes gene_type:complete
MATRDYTTRRSSIVNSLASKLEEINGTGNFLSSVSNVSPRLKFWDEIEEFPAIHINAGSETREYLGAGEKFRYLTLTVRCYVQQDDAVEALEKLMEDVETVLETNNPITYTNNLGAVQSTIQTTIVSIDTDEGVLDPLGIGELTCVVQY